MKSILREIHNLRSDNEGHIDRKNTNRHRVIIDEPDGTKTSYYFSAPIYNIQSGKIVDFAFHADTNGFTVHGSNTKTTVGKEVRIAGQDGSCRIQMNGEQPEKSDREIRYDTFSLFPTTNGVAYQVTVDGVQTVSFELEVTLPFLNIRANDKCFAFMKEKFLPFMTVSCIGTLNSNHQVVAPAVMHHQKINDQRYRISVSSCSSLASSVMFEVNMYEPKLFQDTTVESKNPQSNNAFGSTAFIGRTEQFGEQWLYLRPLFSSLSEYIEQRQNKLVLHLPTYSSPGEEMPDLFMIVSRFCSFGSNWENKIADGHRIAGGTYQKGYLSFDLTDFVALMQKNALIHSDGMLLKPTEKMHDATVIATADSYLNLPVIEINFQ